MQAREPPIIKNVQAKIMASGGDGGSESASAATPLDVRMPPVMDNAYQQNRIVTPTDLTNGGEIHRHTNGVVNGHAAQPVEIDNHQKLREAVDAIEKLRKRFLDNKEDIPTYQALEPDTSHRPLSKIVKKMYEVRTGIIRTNLAIEALDELYALLPDELEKKLTTFESICLDLSNEGNDIVDQGDYLRGRFDRISSRAIEEINGIITGKPINNQFNDQDRVDSIASSLSAFHYVVDAEKIFSGVAAKDDLIRSFETCKTKMHVEGKGRQEIGAVILDAISDKNLKPSELRVLAVLDWFLQTTDASTYLQPADNGSIGRLIESLKEGKRATAVDIMRVMDMGIRYRVKQCQDLVGTVADNVTEYLRYRPEYRVESTSVPDKDITVSDKDIQSKIKQPSGIATAEKSLREYFDVPHPNHSMGKPPKHMPLAPNYWHEMKCGLMIQIAEDYGREKKLNIAGAEEGVNEIIKYAREHGYAGNPLMISDMMNNPKQGYLAVQEVIDQDSKHTKNSAKKKGPEILEIFGKPESDAIVNQRKNIVSGKSSTLELSGREKDIVLNERVLKPDATVMATFLDAIRRPDPDRIRDESRLSLKGSPRRSESRNYDPLKPQSMKDYVKSDEPRNVPDHLYAGLERVLSKTAAPLIGIYKQISTIKDPAAMALKEEPEGKSGFLRS